MGRILWAWCCSWLLVLGFAASARADDFSIIRVCARPKGIPANVERWALTPSGTFLVTKNPDDFRQKTRGLTIFVFDPAAPPSSVGLLPIPHNKVQCAPYKPPAPAPPPPPGAGGPPAKPASGAKGAEKPRPAKEKAATRVEDEPPPGLPPPIVYPKDDPEPRPQPPPNGVTAHWPRTVLPPKREWVLPWTTVLPFKDEQALPGASADTQTKVLPMAHVLPWKHEVEKLAQGAKGEGGKDDTGGGEGGSSTGKAPNKVAQKTTFEKIAEQVALAGAIANQQMNADLNRPDGKRFGIVGGTDPNGPNNPAAQATAGAVAVGAAALSAGASKLVKKLQTGLANKTPLLYKEMEKVGDDVAEELVTKLGPDFSAHEVRAGLAQTLTQNGAIGPYDVMQQFTNQLGGKWQAHHLLEVQFAKLFKRQLKITNTDKIPSVILTDAQHKKVTAELARETANVKTPQDLWQAYQEVYRKYPPHWLESIQHYFVNVK